MKSPNQVSGANSRSASQSDEYRVCPHVAFRNMGRHEREMRLRVVLR